LASEATPKAPRPDVPLSPDAPVNIGVIGAGFIAQVAHLHSLAALSGCRIAAIADNRPEFRAQIAQAYRIPQQFDEPEALLVAPGIDANIIVLPRRAMGPVLERAVATGRPVLSEKPMAHTLEQGRRIVAAADASRCRLAVGFMKRHDAGVILFREKLSELVASAEVGDIEHVSMHDYCATYAIPVPQHFQTAAKRPSRYAEWPTVPDGLPSAMAADYEYTLNVASHDINLLRFLLPDGLKARSFVVRQGGSQLATFDGGRFDVTLALAKVDVGRWDQELNVYFRRGRLQLRLPSPLSRQEAASVTFERRGRCEQLTPPPDRRVWAFTAQASHFLDVVRGRAEPAVSGRDALLDLELIEELWKRAVWSQMTVESAR
jgi:predicted dehydrogenase